ncbi:hypothetical protein L6452_03607 [Arctium lappa]|uniref:Uncharacterized protein n=1 Tax=Arctium lappa TaxID=4217 RepID=A0ACB9FNW8_ARCLA|nr:hypothetical protein L6452_03607 [Arctium lappa]
MAIEKNSFKFVVGAGLDSEFSSHGREESMSNEETDIQRLADVESDDVYGDEYEDYDSGAGSDDFDLLELGETGEEFCQIGDQTCCIPFELYDLPGLGDILSMDVWNNVLTDDERFGLVKYLPDMDQETFMRTMKELLTACCNFHFEVPTSKLFYMLKGGLCEPRVALYRQGLGFFQKRRHYHVVRKHQNTMVDNLFHMKEAWVKCRGYGIEEKLRVLNIMKSEKSLICENLEEQETSSSDWEDYGNGFRSTKKQKGRKQKWVRYPGFRSRPTFDCLPRGKQLALEPANYRKENSKGSLKTDTHAFRRNMTVNQLSDIKVLTAKPSERSSIYGVGKKFKHPDNNQEIRAEDPMIYRKFRGPKLSKRDRQLDMNDGVEPFCHTISQGQPGLVEHVDWKLNNKNGMIGRGKDDFLHVKRITKQEKSRTICMQNGGQVVAAAQGMKMLSTDEETESDSSEEFSESDDDDPLIRSKWLYPSSVSDIKTVPDSTKAKFGMKDKKSVGALDGLPQTSGKNDGSGGMLLHEEEEEVEIYSVKAKRKVKTSSGSGRLNSSNIRDLEDTYILGPGKEEIYKLGRNGKVVGEQSETFLMPLPETYPAGKKQKRKLGHDVFVPPPVYLNDYVVDEPGSAVGMHRLDSDNIASGRSANKGQMHKVCARDRPETTDIQLSGCNSLSKKHLKEEVMHVGDQEDHGYLNPNSWNQLDDMPAMKSLAGNKWEDESASQNVIMAETPVIDTTVEDACVENKSQKKPFTLITPTVHTGFSFSIIHLLSAVRMAMITLLPEDSLDLGKHHHVNDDSRNLRGEQKQEGVNGAHSYGDPDTSNSGPLKTNAPYLTVQEIINRVKSNPGDPCILETQEPLHDLVRGVLKIFSSRSSPLGAKGWKALVVYDRSIKSWSWIGPVSRSSSDHEAVEEVTSPDAWGLSYNMLVKLVDSFANWLKSGQDTLQQIGSLPAPPLTLMQVNLDEKERFRDLKAQRSLNTINQSSAEVKDYFHKEEVLRYSIPDRAFAYTAVDGKKSTVAPSKKGAGKPTSKARDHFMLKRDRPPHVTILCLVRDAAARLPGSIGTRADVCTLIRDSQYIVEDVSDAQVNQVVSGALDRLHYERDPCVQFDGERKLWVYLHREREEEDFEDDATSSTKKWKRQKKESIESSDLDAVTLSYHGTSEQTGLDFSSDLNLDPSGIDNDKKEHPKSSAVYLDTLFKVLRMMTDDQPICAHLWYLA